MNAGAAAAWGGARGEGPVEETPGPARSRKEK